MPFKYDSEGHIVVADHNGAKLPVFIHADGREAPFDADGTLQTISARNAEAKANRERAEAAEAAYKPFKDAGITDAGAAAKALGVVKNLDEKKLVDAGERDRAIAEAVRAVEEKFAPVSSERDTLRDQLNGHLIGGVFTGSKFVAEKFAAENGAAAAQIARALFGSHFKVEDGKVVAYDGQGQKMLSRTAFGQPAEPEEALQLLVDASPLKASILRGTNASGSGSQSNTNGGGGGAPRGAQPKRADFPSDIEYQKANAKWHATPEA